ncbi:MAG: L-lactate dehydrogenase [Microgenomates group bacterium]
MDTVFPACKKTKVTMIGAGRVGITAAFTMYLKNTAQEIMLYGRDKDKLVGEQLDFMHSLSFLGTTHITVGSEPKDLTGSDVIVFTAGAAQEPGETRLDLVKKNTAILESIVPDIVKYAPDSIILMVTNPVDVLTYKTVLLSKLPRTRVFGSGTTLDTARFRFHLSEYLHVNPKSVHAYILGEHGDSSFPTLSSANVGGQLLATMKDFSHDKALEAYTKARDAAYKIIAAKGATYYAIGVVINQLVHAILTDAKRVYPLSITLDGEYGHKNVALSVPCVLGRNGIERIVEIPLSEEEKLKMQLSVETLKKYL